MKYTILSVAALFVTAIIVFTACKKKDHTSLNCYTCVLKNKMSSNIPALDTSIAKTTTGTECNMTDGQKNFFVKNSTKTDTFFYSGDTLITRHYTMTCTLQ